MFTHLHLHSPFSFLDGATALRELVARAAQLGMSALTLTDHDNLCGAVLFQRLALEAGIRPIQGAEVTMEGGYHLTLLATGPAGYSNLCRLLTAAHLGNARGEPRVKAETLRKHAAGLIVLSGCRRGEIPSCLLRGDRAAARRAAVALRETFGPDSFFLELEGTMLPGTRRLNGELAGLARELGIGVVGTGNVHYGRKDEFFLHDLLTCVRTLTKLDQVHPARRLNAENYLRSPVEMAEVFREYPEAVANTQRIAERCQPAFDAAARRYPLFDALPPGQSAREFLRELVYTGAGQRYGRVDRRIRERLDHELEIIFRLGYEDYFLLVWDVVRYAREQGIRYAGRGSAADSVVAYCLYITEVDAIARRLLFERFMSLERAQKPDIDIDFDARFRDKVTAYVYERYSPDRVATVCTYNTFHGRSALRDFGKAMDFPTEEIDRIAKRLPYYLADDLEKALEVIPELREARIPAARYEQLFRACAAATGFPRHLGTHLGGVVISRDPLTEVTPLQMAAKGVVVTQFDKEYVEELGLIKLDLLSLRTLSAVEETVKKIGREQPGFDYDRISLDDQPTYRMLNRGETIGVFQLESPAQRALQSRLEASEFEDVVASVALIRPGPIKGNMVEPFIARRQGREPITYLHPKLEPILKKTYGVVLFQEQVIEIATVIAGFTPGEADRLRRVMTHARSRREMDEIGCFFIEKAVANGIAYEVAETIFSYIVGYASYGFCEAHAAAFGSTAFKTAYLVKHYPAYFYAAILSQQPMGYYPAHTICTEARRRGITVLPLDINRSARTWTVEEKGRVIRVSLSQVRGISGEQVERIERGREEGAYRSLPQFLRSTGIDREVAENLILGGAFDAICPNRRALVWSLDEAVRWARLAQADGLWSGEDEPRVEAGAVPDFPPRERFIREYGVLELTPGKHFMDFFRAGLKRKGYWDSRGIRGAENGEEVKVAGLVVRPHRPPTKSGKTIVFLSLEDEHGLIDVTVFEAIYQKYGQFIFGESRPLCVRGKVDRRGRGVSVIAEEIAPMVAKDSE
ncbi:MAG: DNA polymerase III subunit alpha [Bacillota bacterium]